MINNEAEYEALVAGLDLAKAAGAEKMVVHYDSQVITSQINGDYECRNERMKKDLEEVKNQIDSLKVKSCNKCQRFSNMIRQPSEELTPMTAHWPFA